MLLYSWLQCLIPCHSSSSSSPFASSEHPEARLAYDYEGVAAKHKRRVSCAASIVEVYGCEQARRSPCAGHKRRRSVYDEAVCAPRSPKDRNQRSTPKSVPKVDVASTGSLFCMPALSRGSVTNFDYVHSLRRVGLCILEQCSSGNKLSETQIACQSSL